MKLQQQPKLTKIEEILMPTVYGKFILTLYRTNYSNQPDMRTMYVYTSGEITNNPMVRIHSKCYFGDTAGSQLCDCGEQLKESFRMIAEKGGMIIYLDQEGRGHGDEAKMREYKLQQTQGLNTVQASINLHLEPDARKYDVVADVLKAYAIEEIRLLTNNPDKIAQLETLGIKVSERIPLLIQPNPYNEKYISTKQDYLGHMKEN